MLIKHSDAFVLLDDVQYIKDGWIKRNRVLKPSRDDWQYVTVPVKKFHETARIKDIEIDNSKEWKKKIFCSACPLQICFTILCRNKRFA